MTNTNYQRSQVEQALWQVFACTAPERPVHRVFVARIKRLLDLDRTMVLPKEGERYPRPSHPAFTDQHPGSGTHATFSAFNVFCLAIGLDLLDLGFNQRDVVFLLQHIRPDLEKQYVAIMANPPVPRQQVAAEDRPNCPSIVDRGFAIADCRVYMTLAKVEITEVFDRANPKAPMIFAPVFCRGVDAVRQELHERSDQLSKLAVLEIAVRAVMLTEVLETVEPVKRGRPAKNSV